MKKGLFKGAIIGGIIVYIWMMISWMVLPWHKTAMHQFKDEAAVASVIMREAPEDGMYVLMQGQKKESERMEKKGNMNSSQGTMHGQKGQGQQMNQMKKETMKMMEEEGSGPFIFASVRHMAPMGMARPMIVSLLTQLVAAFFITYLVTKTSSGCAYWSRVWFVTVAGGVIVTLLGILPAWNWWSFSSCWTLMQGADLIIGWFLAGLAIAKFTCHGRECSHDKPMMSK